MSASVGIGFSGQKEHDSSAAKKINSLLNSPKTRVEGLRLLNLFLPHCPEEVFLNFCVSWMQNCCKVDGLTKNWKHSSQLLRNLLETSSKYPELKKSVSFFITTRYFDFFFKHLLNSQGGWFCTEACLLFYRGACGTFQESLERQLIREIEKNSALSAAVGHCFALLPCIGGGGSDGMNYKRNWKSQFVKFLDICHSVLNDLFVDVDELQEYETHGHTHKRNESERSVDYLVIQFSNYSSVLSFMLLNQYPAPKAVPSDQIFELVCRGLAPNPRATARHQTTDAISLKKVLPVIYCSLLSLLKAVIVTCKNQLLPYSHLICKLIKQSLEVDFIDVNEKEFKCLRVSTYGVLCDWLAVARNGSCVEVISTAVVSSAVSDIQPKQEVVSLKEAKHQNWSKSKGQATRWINAAATNRLCHAALKAVQFLIRFSGVFLDPGLHKFLQEVVVKLLVELQKSSDFSVPFSLPACRKELYSLLLELTLQPCLKWPPPTNFALRLFSKGLNDSSPEVSSFCSEALNFATIIIHPQYDNGGFPLSISPDDSNRIRELQTREEPMEVENEKEVETFQEEIQRIEENVPESKETVFTETINDAHQESEVSSEEDSRNTITFTKDTPELPNKVLKEAEEKMEKLLPQASQPEEDSGANQQKILTVALEKIPAATLQKTPPQKTPSIRETPETSKINKIRETVRLQDSDGSSSISPEPANEEGHLKKRYFLRSNTKASSEEPEEILKRTSSPEVAKATPSKTLKMTPSVPSSKKRPRTRALSKVGETDVKKSDGEKTEDNDDEEDIKAAFDDSFID